MLNDKIIKLTKKIKTQSKERAGASRTQDPSMSAGFYGSSW